MPPEEVYSTPALSIYQSYAVTPGTAVRFGDKVVLHPQDVHHLRSQLMSNDKADAAYHPTTGPTGTSFPHGIVKQSKTRERAARAPWPAKIGAALLVGALLVWGVVSCGASVAAGAQRAECRAELQKVLSEAGSDRQPTEREIDACVAGEAR